VTSPESSSFNVAGGNASVGIQAHSIDLDGDLIIVEGDVRLTVFPGDSSEDKYRIGLNLDPSRSWSWITPELR